MEKNKAGCGTLILVLVVLAFLLNSCGDSRSSSSYTYKSPGQSYDEKYGAGEYEKDKQMMDSIQKNWDSWTKP